MDQSTPCAILRDQCDRMLWEVKNVIACIPDDMWSELYCGMPLYKHVYHTLHSLDRWMINPRVYREPAFHTPGLNDLDAVTDHALSRAELDGYFCAVADKIKAYVYGLSDPGLLACPPQCEYAPLTLFLAQTRHLSTHMGMLMGFIVARTGQWPRVLGLEQPIPGGPYEKFC